MNPRSAIQKGKELENHVVSQIREKGIDLKAYRSHGSGNGNDEKADIFTSMTILGQAAGIECKNHKTISIPEWWRQTRKLEQIGREPVLVFKIHGEPMENALATVYLDTLLELIKAAGGVKIVQTKQVDSQGARNLKYKTQRVVSSARELIKEIEAYEL